MAAEEVPDVARTRSFPCPWLLEQLRNEKVGMIFISSASSQFAGEIPNSVPPFILPLDLLARRVSSPLPIPRDNPMPMGWPSPSAHPQSGCRYVAGAVPPCNWDYL